MKKQGKQTEFLCHYGMCRQHCMAEETVVGAGEVVAR